MFELHLTMNPAEGALVRVLGTIERRGFPLAGIEADAGSAGLSVTVRVNDVGRPVDVLMRQLKRLPDVREASVEVAKPMFALPPEMIRKAPAPAVKAPSRNSLFWLGIPESVSADAVLA